MTTSNEELELRSDDGHCWRMITRLPAQASAALLWLPAMGVSARNYLPLAEHLAERGVAVFLHEWRGLGSSNLRAGREQDWGYREVLALDLAIAAEAARKRTDAARWIAGGHSLGGQLACCHAGISGHRYDDLWLVATGTPYWRTFAHPRRWLLPSAYRFMAWLARRRGALPGRQLGFAGIEARSLIHDWSRVGLSNRYHAPRLDHDLEAALQRLHAPVRGVRFRDDWLAPATSMAGLAAKMPQAPFTSTELDASELGVRADHFSWMKKPDAVAAALLSRDNDPSAAGQPSRR